MEKITFKFTPAVCNKHQTRHKEIWAGQFGCLSCFEEYMAPVIEEANQVINNIKHEYCHMTPEVSCECQKGEVD